MTTEPQARRSRRSLLAAAAGGAAVLAAARLPDPDAVAAANPPLLLDQDNAITALTSLTGNGINGFKVTTGTQATAIWGISNSGAAIVGQSTTGWGVSGSADTGVAMNANSSSGIAVDASSTSSIALRGWTITGTGAIGHVGAATPAAAPGVALCGSVSSKSQVGLRAFGHVQFPDRSGRATIGTGRSYVDVDLTAKGLLGGTPLCFANLQANRTGVYVSSVRPNYPATGKLRIQLNRAVTSATYVAWLVMG